MQVKKLNEQVMLRADGMLASRWYPAWCAGVGLTKTAAVEARARGARWCCFADWTWRWQAGEMVAIVGESGSGKSSLLHLLAALDRPTAGEVWCGETAAKQGRRVERAAGGGVSQPRGGICVAVPLSAAGVYGAGECGDAAAGAGRAEGGALEKARMWLEEVGLAERAEHRSGELSGGEQQRVSLARALVTGPKLLLADEPTGDLDGKTAEVVFALIQRLHREHRLTSVLVTHNMEFAVRCGRVMRLRDGGAAMAAGAME